MSIFSQPFEFEERLLTKNDAVDLTEDQAGLARAIIDCLVRKPVIMLDPTRRSSWPATAIRPSTTSAAAASW